MNAAQRKRIGRLMVESHRRRVDRDQRAAERIAEKFEAFLKSVDADKVRRRSRGGGTGSRARRITMVNDCSIHYQGNIVRDMRTLLRQAFRLAIIRDARARERAR